MFNRKKKHQHQINAALKTVMHPLLHQNIVDLGLVQGVQTDEKERHIIVVMESHNPDIPLDRDIAAQLEYAVKDSLKCVRFFKHVHVVISTEKTPIHPIPPIAQPTTQGRNPTLDLPNIKHIIAVGSGKGGVGKSTIALNLAVSLAKTGLQVGLMDADIYGPSVPRLVGLKDQSPPPVQKGDKMPPFLAHGIKIMSMGFLVKENTATVWRAPMIQSAVLQMLRDVDWGNLDVLIIDLPPGTGDIQLTLSQKIRLSGAVIVSTPQDIALIDARKAIHMFQKLHVPILGIIENMSYFLCPKCGTQSDIFGHGGARADAVALSVPFLGEIPLHATIRSQSDAGLPVSTSQNQHATIFAEIAQSTLQSLKQEQKPFPKIVFA